uniref:Uncharacterized protein n=1 Tax=Romanomermis culicivorax TaxID=13658 RepID=A0A915I5C7_ROMCU
MKLKRQVVRAILFIVRVQRLTKNRKKSSLYPNRDSSSEEKVDSITNGGHQGAKIRPIFGRNASAISFATDQPEKSFFGRKRFNNREDLQHDIRCKYSQSTSSSGHVGVSVSSKHHQHHPHRALNFTNASSLRIAGPARPKIGQAELRGVRKYCLALPARNVKSKPKI